MMCYTIGYSDKRIESFIDIMKIYGIDCIMDFRKKQNHNEDIKIDNKDEFQIYIEKSGINYIYMGNIFEKDKYNNYKDLKEFNNILNDKKFKIGVNKILMGIKNGCKIAILGNERNPFNCYRSILIGYVLKKKGVNIKHIIDKSTLKTQERIEEEIFARYEPLIKKDLINLTIQQIIENENYDKFNEKDIKKNVIEKGYRMKFKEIISV